MACRVADGLIIDQAIGELAPAGRAKLWDHLSVCIDCRDRSRWMRRVVELADYVLRRSGEGCAPGAAVAKRRVR